MDKKNKIILAAVSEFAKNGFEKASIDAIALKAKVAKGTVFYHFKSKNDLFAGIVDESQKKLGEKMIEEIEVLKNNKDRIGKIIDIEVDFIEKYHDLFSVYLEDVVKKTISFEIINQVLKDGVKSGEFRKDLDIEVASLSIFWTTAMVCLNQKKINRKKVRDVIINGL